MGGQNPYIEDVNVERPSQKFTVTFIDEQKRVYIFEQHNRLSAMLLIKQVVGFCTVAPR